MPAGMYSGLSNQYQSFISLIKSYYKLNAKVYNSNRNGIKTITIELNVPAEKYTMLLLDGTLNEIKALVPVNYECFIFNNKR